MLQYRWFVALIHTFIIMGLLFLFSGCAKQQSKTADVVSTPEFKQEIVAEKKSASERPEETKPLLATQAQTEIKQEVQPSVVEKEAVAKESAKKELAIRTQYIVKKGDCLWWTAQYKDVYNDSFMWSIIYEANKDKIKDPNLIYPGQKLNIPRKGYTLEKIKILRKKAGATKPYLPPKKANLPVD